MPTELISIFAQIPIVVFFGWFVLQTNKTRQESIATNHAEWRDWMEEQNRHWREWLTEHSKNSSNTINEIHARHREERVHLNETLRHLDQQIERLNKTTMLVYAAIRTDDNGAELSLLEEPR